MAGLDWTFNKVNTKQYTHAYHVYPAMMIPQIARGLISEYLLETDRVILDPYCGSGTTLVEANLSGRSAIGIDINPLALMIARSKVTAIDSSLLDTEVSRFGHKVIDGFPQYDDLTYDPVRFDRTIGNVSELDYWFPSYVQPILRSIRHHIDGIEHADVKLFFSIALSETIRDTSFLNKGGYKRHRMKDITTFSPDAYGLMCKKLERNRGGLRDFMDRTAAYTISNEFLSCNTVHTVEAMHDKKIDAIITSPPYGDSRTTVAYGEFSSFSLDWLGCNGSGIDRMLMGGKTTRVDETQFPKFLQNIIGEIRQQDERRADDVAAFYADYQSSISNVSKLLKTGAYAIYVVGNRIVKDQKLPTDEITQNFFEQNNYRHVSTHHRAIPSKRMPRSNSPSNEKGKTVSTMNEEHIVVMQKC